MKLLNLETQEEFEAEVIEIDDSDYSLIKSSPQFGFDWSKEKSNHIFKIVKAGEEKKGRFMHGLISISDYPKEWRIHINLIESAVDNRSPNKKVDRVAGCLLSFAVQIAFEKGYFGFTSLVPKTKLIPLYVQKYGFKQFGQQLAIEGRDAIQLIETYQ